MDNKITNADLKKILSGKLSGLRARSGETIEETAFALGMDTSDYFKLLRGQRLPHLLTLIRISQKYGVGLNWWFAEFDTAPKTKEKNKNNYLEFRIAKIVKPLNERLQKAALSMLKTSVKNLVSVSKN
jgi:transcriptional regulator with XRE-family HTH domain